MSISTDSLIPLIQVFILKTVHYLCSPQCNVAVSTQGPHYYHLHNSCLFVMRLKSEKQKYNSGHRLLLQSNRNIKCEILKYAIIIMRGVDCVTLTTEVPGMRHCHCWDLKYPLYSGWCIGISVDSLQASDWSLCTDTAPSLADQVMDLVYTWYKGENDEFKKCLGG